MFPHLILTTLKEAFIANKNLNNAEVYTWYIHALKVFEDITDYENTDKPFHKIKSKLKCSIKQIVENNYKSNNVKAIKYN